jgi:hypothetical protein
MFDRTLNKIKFTAIREVGREAIAADAATKWRGNLSFLFSLN